MYGMRSPAIPIVLAYAAGLAFQYFMDLGHGIPFLLSLLSFVGLFYSIFRGFSFPNRHLTGFFFLFAWFAFGLYSGGQEEKGKAPSESASLFSEQNEKDGRFLLSIISLEDVRERSTRFRAEVLPSETSVLLTLKGDEGKEALPGDRILCRCTPKPFRPSKGPASFDSKSFYAERGIHYRLELAKGAYRALDDATSWNPRILALRWREHFYRKLRDETPLEGQELEVASALWLGRKLELSEGLREAYADAGAMHVLAVSGLHVGIVYFMLLILLAPLKKSLKGKKAIPIIILAVLWGYAILTGWSASVVRAVLMFSLYTLGQSLERAPTVGNAIAGSALIVLLFDPSMIHDIGFLLSYAAVISIVTLYPLLDGLWKGGIFPLAQLKSLLAVSTAAQIGVLPIVLGVFGKFPLWFLVTNPLILPLGTLALYSGPLMAVSFLFPNGVEWMGFGIEKLLALMNGWVELVAGWPGSGIEVVPLDLSTSLALAGALACSIFGFYRKLPAWMVHLSWTFFLSILSIKDLQREQKELLIQHAGNDPPVTAIRKGEKALLWTPDSLKGYRKKRILEYWEQKGVKPALEMASKPANIQGMSFSGMDLLFIDKKPKRWPSSLLEQEWELLLWKDRSDLPSGMEEKLSFKKGIILETSSSIQSHKEMLQEEGGKYHVLPERGAYIAPLSYLR